MPSRGPTSSAAAKPAPWRERLARWVLGASHGVQRSPMPRGAVRSYAAARVTRLTEGFGSASDASADAELHGGLALLRSRARQMVRDSAFAKRAKTSVVNNIIGSGVGLQAQVATIGGTQATRVNDQIEAEFERWCAAETCHTGGALHFHDLERAAMGQVFEAGEVLVRLHQRPFGGSRIALALELIEAERLAPPNSDFGGVAAGNELRLGVECDAFGRAVAYWIRRRHASDISSRAGAKADSWERVPAADVLHLRVIDRWPQTRGEPWLHTVLRKIDDLNEYTQLEVIAARGSAAYFATIETDGEPPRDDEEADGQGVVDLEPLTVQGLRPGEKLQFHTPNRPNSALDPFVRAMLREIAAGAGTSYESVSRDYSQTNYSSSRLALLDDRDTYKALQQWWIRSFRLPLHAIWIAKAAAAGVLTRVPWDQYVADPARFEAARFKPRGWGWIDPTKEVAAYKEAIKAGLTTSTDVIAATADGRDFEEVLATMQRERAALAAAGVVVDTTVAAPQPTPAAAGDSPGGQAGAAAEGDDDAPDDDAAEAAASRVIAIASTRARTA